MSKIIGFANGVAVEETEERAVKHDPHSGQFMSGGSTASKAAHKITDHGPKKGQKKSEHHDEAAAAHSKAASLTTGAIKAKHLDLVKHHSSTSAHYKANPASDHS